MMNSDRIDPRSFLATQLYSVPTSSVRRIVIGGIITPIARLVCIEPNPNDRVLRSKWLKMAAFKLIKFCKVKAG